jgi:hypothetical protein
MQLQKLTGAALAAAFALLLAPAPTEAKGGGHGQGGGAVKPAKTAKPTMKVSAKAHGSQGKGQTQRAAKATKVTTKSAQGAAKSTRPAGSKKTRTATADKGKAIDTGKTHKKTATTTSGSALVPTDGPGTPIDPTMNKAQQKLAQNANLRAKLQTRLPLGTDINAAAAGFRNLGQFVAAVNVAYNHGISFDALRQRMTGPEPMSLGQALQQVKGLNGAVASTTAQTALAQAEADIQATTTTTSRKPGKRRS